MLVTSVEWCDSCMQLLLFSGWGQHVRHAGLFTIASLRLGIGLLSLVRNSKVFAIQGVLSIEVRYITWVSAIEGCPFN